VTWGGMAVKLTHVSDQLAKIGDGNPIVRSQGENRELRRCGHRLLPAR
jgi:hypothetical protein